MARQKTSKAEKKRIAAAELLGPGADVRTYVSGVGHARFTPTLGGLIGGFAVVSVFSVAVLHVFLIPGVVLVFAAYRMIRPAAASRWDPTR